LSKLHDSCNIHDFLEDTIGLQELELPGTNSNIDQLKYDAQDQNKDIWCHLQHIHPSNCKIYPPDQVNKTEGEEFGLVHFESRKELNTKQ
jgi:hypothetical protein